MLASKCSQVDTDELEVTSCLTLLKTERLVEKSGAKDEEASPSGRVLLRRLIVPITTSTALISVTCVSCDILQDKRNTNTNRLITSF